MIAACGFAKGAKPQAAMREVVHEFTYSSGQRPLDGFTLKRGVGRGGFGEVYFAVSDGGKEVALKLVRGESRNRAARREPSA